MNKLDLRKKLRKHRQDLDDKFISEASELICGNIKGLKEFNLAKNIMMYISFDNEVNLKKLFLEDNNKSFFAPICIDKQDMISVPMEGYSKLINSNVKKDLLEPDVANREDCKDILEIVIVPGIVFDRDGNRIGFGAGYYDRFLNKIDKNVTKIGVCYEFQIVESIEKDDNDIPVDYVVTEKNIYKILY